MTVHAQQLYSAAQVHLREAERLRKKNVPFALLFLLLALAAPVWSLTKMALILIHNTGEDISEWLFIGVMVFSIIAILAIHGLFFRGVHIIFREKVVPKMVGMFGEDFHYTPGKGVDRSWGEQCKLLPEFSVWGDKDLVRGEINGRLLECSGIVLKDRGRRMIDLQTSINQSVQFRGVFVHLELPRAIPHPVWIIPQSVNLRYQLPQLKKLDNRQEVPLEQLDTSYRLITAHPETARQWFTPSALGTINNLIDHFRQEGISQHLRIAFFGHHVCFACKRKRGLFALSWFPFFTNLDSLRFVERQIIVLQAILKQGAALQEMETST